MNPSRQIQVFATTLTIFVAGFTQAAAAATPPPAVAKIEPPPAVAKTRTKEAATTNKPVAEENSSNKSQVESEAMNQTLANIFKAMSRSSINFSFDGAVIQAPNPDQDATTEIINLESQAYFSFSSEIVQDLISSAPSKPQSETEKQLIPKLHLATQDMLVVFDYKNIQGNQKVHVDFLNAKKPDRNKPIALLVTVANQLNNSLIALRLHSIDLTLTRAPENKNKILVNGQCQSDKTVFDFFSNSEKTINMLCQFKGFYQLAESSRNQSDNSRPTINGAAKDKDSYNIAIKYVDKPTEIVPPVKNPPETRRSAK